jgi:hypothetical protein
MQNSYQTHTTSNVGAGGLARIPTRDGAAAQWLIFQLALIPQPAFLQSGQMYVVVCL